MDFQQPTAPGGQPRPNSRSAGTARGPLGAFRNTGFVACLVLLLAMTAGFQYKVKTSGAKLVKKGIYCRKQLRHLDQSKLMPYKVLQAGDIKPEILDSLGTKEYIQWTLEDTSILDRKDPARLIHFFVTYYTDTPGQVPHVPEECYLGGGYAQSSEELLSVPVPEINDTVKVKVLTFERSDFLSRESRAVMYTFHVNGQFAAERRVVIGILNNPSNIHSYFSKVELSFGTSEAAPSPERSIEAGKKFLALALPVLIKDHWPDFAAAEQAARQAPVAAGKKSD